MDIEPNSPFLKELAERFGSKKVRSFRELFSAVKKRFNKIVNFREILYVLRTLPFKEKNIVFALFGVGIFSLAIFFWKLKITGRVFLKK